MKKAAAVGLLGVILLVVGVSCSSGSDSESEPIETTPQAASYTDVAPAQAVALIVENADVVILDVSPVYAQGHIPGAVNHVMADGSLAEAIPGLDADVPYLVYCHSDSVSIAAAELLVDAGFERVYRLAGNYAAWVATEYGTVAGSDPGPGFTVSAGEWWADGVILDAEYAASDRFGDYSLYWRSDDEYVYVGIEVKTDGWVALGIQPGNRMKDADMIFGYVENGEAKVVDQFSTGDFGPHRADTEIGGSDDIIEFSGSESGGLTTIEFKRALATGDEFDNELVPGRNQILWAYGLDDRDSQRHSMRGYGAMKL